MESPQPSQQRPCRFAENRLRTANPAYSVSRQSKMQAARGASPGKADPSVPPSRGSTRPSWRRLIKTRPIDDITWPDLQRAFRRSAEGGISRSTARVRGRESSLFRVGRTRPLRALPQGQPAELRQLFGAFDDREGNGCRRAARPCWRNGRCHRREGFRSR